MESIEFPSFETPCVSIIVPVFNKWPWTYSCLKSVSANSGNQIPYEIIVANDASTDETAVMLSKVKGITVIDHKTNIGFLKNCNYAARTARGKYIVFLNNDTLVKEQWLHHLYSLLDSDPEIGMAGAKLLCPDQSLQEAGGIVFSDPRQSAFQHGRYDDPSAYQYNYVKEVDYCSGACLLLRKDIFDRLNGFDEQYAPAYYEDADLAFSLRSLGYKVVYQPKAEVVHFEGISHGKDTGDGIKAVMELNRVKFHRKWHDVLIDEHGVDRGDIFLARDRSQKRKRLLYIDHKVPAWDRDTGSLVTFEYLKILLELGYKIMFWPDDLKSREPYTSRLQQMGVEIVYGAHDFRKFMKKTGRFIDLVFLARPETSMRYIKEVKKHSKAKSVYICIDLHFLREQRRGELEHEGKCLRTAEQFKKVELYLMRNTDATVVFSGAEKELLYSIDPAINVFVLPFVQTVSPAVHGFDDRKDLVFVGNYDHHPNEDAVLWFVEELFPSIKAAIPGVRFIAAGNNPTRRMLELESPDVIVTGYVEDIAPFFQTGRVFVSPLRYGAGLKGKILQAMSCGSPVVSTSIGVEGMEVSDGENVLIADGPAQFVNSTVELYRNRKQWEDISAGAQQFIQSHYTKDIVKDKFKELLADTA